MVNITHKPSSLRMARAIAIVQLSATATMDAIVQRKVPKGDVLEFSRAAGLLAIKKTSDVIPDCHPLPVEYAAITHRFEELRVIIEVEVHTIYRTGVEVEAMHGAAITALTMYDMLKPIDKGIEIHSIRLLEKKGGKTDFKKTAPPDLRCAVIVSSDTVSTGAKEDKSGRMILEKMQGFGIQEPAYAIVPDDVARIRSQVNTYCEDGYHLILITGGTGLSPRDVTPEAVLPLLTREIPGIMEAARNYGQQRTPYAMLSRGVAGFIGKTLLITLPGSSRGAAESLDALFPYLFHVFAVAEGMRHD